MKVSGCLITKNEAHNLERCVNSMKSIINELIVVDTGSTDNTVETAEAFGASVYHYEWTGDFSAARNAAIEKATGDWIVFLDADEWFASEQDANNLRLLMDKVDGQKKTFGLTVEINNYRKEETGGLSLINAAVTTRAFKNQPDVRYKGIIHELVEPANRNAFYDVNSKVRINHDGYSPELMPAKAKRNLELLFKDYGLRPDEDVLLYHIGNTYMLLKDYAQAYEYLVRYVRTGHKSYMYGIEGVILALASAEQLKRPYEERMEISDYSVKQYPNHPTAFMLRGQLFYQQTNYVDALKNYEKAFRLKAVYRNDLEYSSNLREEDYQKVYYYAGHICSLRGDFDKAARYFSSSLKLNPRFEDAAKRLIATLSRGDQAEAVRVIDDVYPQMSLEDLEFLLPILRTHVPKEAFLTYFEKWFGMTGKTDVNFYVMLTLIGEYRQAFDSYKQRYLDSDRSELYLVYMTGVAVMAGDADMASETLEQLSPQYRPPLEAIFGIREELVRDGQWDMYHVKALDHMLMTYGPRQNVLLWAKLTKDVEVAFAAGRLLYDLELYDPAMELIQTAYDSGELSSQSTAACTIRFMQYNLLKRNKEQAARWLQQCKQIGMVQNEAESFAKWINKL